MRPSIAKMRNGQSCQTHEWCISRFRDTTVGRVTREWQTVSLPSKRQTPVLWTIKPLASAGRTGAEGFVLRASNLRSWQAYRRSRFRSTGRALSAARVCRISLRLRLRAEPSSFVIFVPCAPPSTRKLAASVVPHIQSDPLRREGCCFVIASRPSRTQSGSKSSSSRMGNRKCPPQRINSRIAG